MTPDAGRRLIDSTVVPRRATASAVLAGAPVDPFPLGRADLLYLWDEYGVEHLDFDAVMHPFGHRFKPLRDAVAGHMRYYGWTAPPGRHLQRWPVALAARLSGEFTGPGEEPRRVLFCEGERHALAEAVRAACPPGTRPVAATGDPSAADWTGAGALVASVVDRSHSPAPFLRDWVDAARARGLPVVFDESLTGFGRTGLTWGQEHVGVVADLTVLGGPVGGGLPLGAVVAPARFLPAGPDSPHAGHPWACAAGAVVLDTLNPAMLTHADDCGREVAAVLDELCRQFPDRLAGHHGVGLLRGLRFRDPSDAAAFPGAALRRGLHLAPAVGATVTIAPVLVSSVDEMRRGLEIAADALLSWEDGAEPGQPGVEGR